jgi:hypothetical protein
MNRDRRDRIAKLTDTLGELQSELESLAEEEREAFDNMPESLQSSDRGQAAETASDALDSAVSSLTDLIDYLNEAEGV